jgi:hypothetical protein
MESFYEQSIKYVNQLFSANNGNNKISERFSCQQSNIVAISCLGDDEDACFVLGQHIKIDVNNATTLT